MIIGCLVKKWLVYLRASTHTQLVSFDTQLFFSGLPIMGRNIRYWAWGLRWAPLDALGSLSDPCLHALHPSPLLFQQLL